MHSCWIRSLFLFFFLKLLNSSVYIFHHGATISHFKCNLIIFLIIPFFLFFTLRQKHSSIHCSLQLFKIKSRILIFFFFNIFYELRNMSFCTVCYGIITQWILLCNHSTFIGLWCDKSMSNCGEVCLHRACWRWQTT